MLLTVGLGAGMPVVLEFLHTGMVPRLPTALLATGLVLASSLAFVCGLVLDQVARGRKELKRLAYLSIPAIGNERMTMRHVAGAADPPAGDYDADVVILSLDRAAETAAAIQSALAQTGVSRHVFIVDQGSRPDALAHLAGIVAGREPMPR